MVIILFYIFTVMTIGVIYFIKISDFEDNIIGIFILILVILTMPISVPILWLLAKYFNRHHKLKPKERTKL